MNEKEVEGINFEADENGQAADSVKPETATSDEERKQEEQIAGPVKRGRGRPPKNQKSEQAEAANSEAFAEAAETMQGIHVSDSSEAEQEDSPDPQRTDVAYQEKPPVHSGETHPVTDGVFKFGDGPHGSVSDANLKAGE